MLLNFRKNKNKNFFSNFWLKFGGVLILLIAVFLVITDIKIYKKKQQFNTQVENLENKIQDLESKNNNLQQGISNAENEEYIEKIAREELDLQKPGEKVVSFIIDQDQQTKNNDDQKNIFQILLSSISNIWKSLVNLP